MARYCSMPQRLGSNLELSQIRGALPGHLERERCFPAGQLELPAHAVALAPGSGAAIEARGRMRVGAQDVLVHRPVHVGPFPGVILLRLDHPVFDGADQLEGIGGGTRREQVPRQA